MLRLFRRSLLCLVVGVTAFGVAGWAFRPKATWTAEFPTRGLNAMTFHVAEPNEESPIWIGWLPRGLDEFPPTEVRLQAIDPATGRDAASVRQPVVASDDGVFHATGGFVRVSRRTENGREVSHFEHFDWRTNATSTFSLEGRWRFGTDRRHIWRLQPIPGGFRFLERAMSNGAATREFDCLGSGGPPKDFTHDVSADGRWFAFLVADDKARAAPKLVEVWDAEKGSLFRKLTVPDTFLNLRPKSDQSPKLSFHKGWLTLYPPSGDADWSYVATTEMDGFMPHLAIKPTQFADGDDVYQMHDGTPKSKVWVKCNYQTGRTAFSVIEGDADVVVPWRFVPFPVPQNMAFADLGVGISFAAVPGKSQIICRTIEPSLAADLPSGVAKLLPARWRRNINVHTRWHDWTGSEWREVGCSADDVIFQIRPDRYVTRFVRPDDDESQLVLQSWPLPPRDPKWPALGVAALCAAGTWWACAKRYKRRKRLVSIGAG